jgi:hypothetical protein
MINRAGQAIMRNLLGERRHGDVLLQRAGLIWFVAAVAGQAAFVAMILAHYGRKAIIGDFAGWNDKPLIKGYIAGDSAGNVMFALHVLLAAMVTFGGLLQMVPWLRRHRPALHRWNGRLFFIVAVVMACGGLWLTWVRPTYLSLISAVAVSLNGALILLFVAMAWRHAIRRDVIAHRRWAMRAFLAVNGVWFLRVGIMGWVLISRGGLGMNRQFSGPADILLQFGAYLLPLAVLEAYFRAQSSAALRQRRLAASLVLASTGFMIIGIVGAIAFMWGPYIR